MARLGGLPRDLLIVAIIALAASASFGLGYLAGEQSAGQGSPLTLTVSATPLAGAVGLPADAPEAAAMSGAYVASKNGTKYYLATCTGAKRISDANKVFFASASAAQAAGYTPSATCKGL